MYTGVWGSSFQRLQHRVRSRVCILGILVIRKDYKDMSQPNSHVIFPNKFDVPFSGRASPNAENGCLVVGCVDDVVASMIMVTLVRIRYIPLLIVSSSHYTGHGLAKTFCKVD